MYDHPCSTDDSWPGYLTEVVYCEKFSSNSFSAATASLVTAGVDHWLAATGLIEGIFDGAIQTLPCS